MNFDITYIESASREVYARMQEHGLRMDTARLDQAIQEMAQNLAQVLAQIKEISGGWSIRPNSSHDIADLLKTRGITAPTTQKGNPSITQDFLAKLVSQDPVIPLIAQAKAVAYQLSSARGVQGRVVEGRVYPQWKFNPALGRPHCGSVNPLNWA